MINELKKYLRHPFAFHPKHSALLVIDMQRFFIDKSSHAYLPLAKPIVPRIRKLINFYRRHKLPVIFTKHAVKKGEPVGIMGRWWRDTIHDGTLSARLHPQMRPLSGELVIRKTRYNAFYGTGLDSALKKLGVRKVVITGVATHLCCETTARDAFVRDYEVFFVADATASSDKTLHLSSLKTLANGFAVILETRDILCANNQ